MLNYNISSKLVLFKVSLSSNQEGDLRFSTIYAKIGVYRGRIYAVKKSPRLSVDVTRKLKKELKVSERTFI